MTRPPHRRLGAAYANEVGPEHVGRRVTIRHLVDDAGTERPTDVVGVLRGWDPEGTASVERRDGSTTEVAVASIVASRVIPAAPPGRRPR